MFQHPSPPASAGSCFHPVNEHRMIVIWASLHAPNRRWASMRADGTASKMRISSVGFSAAARTSPPIHLASAMQYASFSRGISAVPQYGGFKREVIMRTGGILAAVLLAAASPAFAADIPAPSKIEAVTVFPSGAEVTRTAEGEAGGGRTYASGERHCRRCHPASIRVEAAAADRLEIGSVDASQVNLASTDPAVAQSARKTARGRNRGARRSARCRG